MHGPIVPTHPRPVLVKIKTDEIVSVIKQEIEQFSSELEVSEVGRVVEVGDGIARIYGLAKRHGRRAARVRDRRGAVMGQVMNLERTPSARSSTATTSPSRRATSSRARAPLEVPVGETPAGPRGRPAGPPIDDGPAIEATETRKVDIIAPGIADRQPVHEPLQFGHQGRRRDDPHRRGPARADHRRPQDGQDRGRDRHDHQPEAPTGAPTTPSHCIYVAVGQKESTVAGVVEKLKKHGAMDYTIVVNAAASDPAPMQYIAPYAGCAMGEHFMYSGRRVLVARRLSKRPPLPQAVAAGLRRPVQAGRGVPPALAAAAPPARARGLPRRRVLPPQPPARAGHQAQRRQRRAAR